MGLHRRAAKRDAAEPAIVEALRALGWSILKISVKDAPDLVIARRRVTLLAEVKTGRAKLQEGQASFAQSWSGLVVVLRSVDDVVRISQVY
jgi:Holliday junction resolvase